MITLILIALAAWLGFNVVTMLALTVKYIREQRAEQREVRSLETLWSLS